MLNYAVFAGEISTANMILFAVFMAVAVLFLVSSRRMQANRKAGSAGRPARKNIGLRLLLSAVLIGYIIFLILQNH